MTSYVKRFSLSPCVHLTLPSQMHSILYVHTVTMLFAQVIALFQLYDQGHIKSLDDPLSHYCLLFSIRDPFNTGDVVTLR